MADDKAQPLLPSESPLLKAETERYVENQKSADFNRNISGYMFWGATSIMAALAIGFLGSTPIGAPLLIGALAASAATFAGSLYFSNKATEIAERSNVLYSDIDSHNKARRMVQTFARAQTASRTTALAGPASDNLPYTASSQTNWVERTGSQPASQNLSWQEQIATEANLEDQRALQEMNAR